MNSELIVTNYSRVNFRETNITHSLGAKNKNTDNIGCWYFLEDFVYYWYLFWLSKNDNTGKCVTICKGRYNKSEILYLFK